MIRSKCLQVRRPFRLACAFTCIALLALVRQILAEPGQSSFKPLDYQIQLDAVLQSNGTDSFWYHPRVTPIPSGDPHAEPVVLLTLQKHLQTSDHYSGLYDMLTKDLGRTWSQPQERAALGWVRKSGLDANVADVTPGWHASSGKVLALGASVRYTADGQEARHPRANQTGYAVYDPKSDTWTSWREIELPPDKKFDFARSACAQWLIRPDGTLLLPFYFGPSATGPWKVCVVRCSFDGKQVKYLEHGNELEQAGGRGLSEPSLVVFNGRYFLTMRHDTASFVSVVDDGLSFSSAEPWRFDDEQELGSYNTQQHWLAHSDGLLLVYTRKYANNDHIERHRAPLFIAQIDPDRLRVVRSTERVLIPERGAEMGNFGAAAINAQQSWVTVSEGSIKQPNASRPDGTTWVARVVWSKPNRSLSQ